MARRARAAAILFKGRDLASLPERAMRDVRGADITMVFQEPMTSLNPLHTIERQIGEVLRPPSRPDRARPPGGASWNCSTSSACATRSAAWAPTRTSCPAASASG